jgi:hypothetical protein
LTKDRREEKEKLGIERERRQEERIEAETQNVEVNHVL